MLESVYRGYLAVLGRLGLCFVPNHHSPHNSGQSESLSFPFNSFEELDAHATALGSRYRGIGVNVGILGIFIVFCAVAPSGLSLDEHAAHLVGMLEVGLMLLTICLIVYGRKSDIAKTWIAARSKAELKRYEQLDSLIKAELAAEISGVLKSILAGDSGQVSYNQRKHIAYERVEYASKAFTWICFFLALLGAAAHLFFHAPWLIFLTALLPAAVGAVHGINGFLQIEELAEQHHVMSTRLNEILERINHPKGGDAEMIELAKLTYQLLTSRDAQWAESAKKLDLKPA